MAARKVKTASVDKPKTPKKRSVSGASDSKNGAVSDIDVYDELQRLAAYIDAAKREIANIRPDDVTEKFVPDAVDELDAVIEATATATNTIMDSCELIEEAGAEADAALGAKLMQATTQIYEACTFQDITGQRITKVVGALKNIEERIDALVKTLGDDHPPTSASPQTPQSGAKKTSPASDPGRTSKVSDADLLEGPQLGDKAKNQAEIDDILASFD